MGGEFSLALWGHLKGWRMVGLECQLGRLVRALSHEGPGAPEWQRVIGHQVWNQLGAAEPGPLERSSGTAPPLPPGKRLSEQPGAQCPHPDPGAV